MQFLDEITVDATDDIEQAKEDRKERGFEQEGEIPLDIKYMAALIYNHIRIEIQHKTILTMEDYCAAASKAVDEIYRPQLEKQRAEALEDPSLREAAQKEINLFCADHVAHHERQFLEYYDEFCQGLGGRE